ncbi:hypothetical protein FQA47_020304 [Oryzias melastigma]|uniref:Uncharacterized protein n=1 Tax=Oryzias melastigma TaxID=30732 RepID=A0A834KX23_ORYME|nr:hypothetical protein FQA47_020304 [Oryzias melastigma]
MLQKMKFTTSSNLLQPRQDDFFLPSLCWSRSDPRCEQRFRLSAWLLLQRVMITSLDSCCSSSCWTFRDQDCSCTLEVSALELLQEELLESSVSEQCYKNRFLEWR